MHYIKNWPEGLFILLVMFGPLAVAFLCRGLFNFVVTLVGGVIVGFGIWVGIIFFISRYFDHQNKKDTATTNSIAVSESSSLAVPTNTDE